MSCLDEKTQFRVTEEHIKLLKNMYIGWDYCEYGAPAVDCKRPYGNSDVTNDIANILDWKTRDPYDEDKEYNRLYDKCRKIHEEMQTVIQILVALSDTGIKPGLYETFKYKTRKWTRIGD